MTDNTFRGAFNPAIFMSTGATVSIEDNTIENALVGVVVLDMGTQATIADNTISNVQTGVVALLGSPSMTVTGNAITGMGEAFGFGIVFDAGASGSASGNTISNFKDNDTGQTSCGILIDAAAGTVTIGANTFPDPPGNEQNVCDNRP